MTNEELKQRALIQLREWREEESACRSIEFLAAVLGCDEKLLFNWDEDTGILVDLEYDGLVEIIGDDCVVAVGRMEWGW